MLLHGWGTCKKGESELRDDSYIVNIWIILRELNEPNFPPDVS